jgi:hypothetical protein
MRIPANDCVNRYSIVRRSHLRLDDKGLHSRQLQRQSDPKLRGRSVIRLFNSAVFAQGLADWREYEMSAYMRSIKGTRPN